MTEALVQAASVSDAVSETKAARKRYRLMRRMGSIASTVLLAPFRSFDLLRNLVVSLAVIAFTLGLCLLVYKSLTSKAIVIAPLSVPTVLEERGLNGEVMARRITDEVRRISLTSSTVRDRSAVGGAAIESKLADVDVPIAGVNFRAIVATIRAILGLKDQQIGGEITVAGAIPSVKPEDEDKPTPPALFEVTLRASDGGAFHTSAKASSDLNMVIREAALKVVEQIDPFLAVSYFRTTKDYPAMERIVSSILKEGSAEDRQWTMNLHGAALRDQRRYGEAISVLKEAVIAAPGWSPPRLNLLQTLRLDKKNDEAIALAQQHLATTPNDAITMVHLALSLQETGKSAEAKNWFEKAIATAPQDPVIAANVASYFRGRNDLKTAEDILERHWALFRKERAANNVRGLIMRDKGNLDEAERLFSEAASLKGPNLFPQPSTNLGLLHLQRNKPELALKSFDRALTEDPMFFQAFNGRGDAYRALNRFKDAELAYREAMKLRPDGAHERHFLAVTLKEQKKWKDAIPAFADAARYTPRRKETFQEWAALLVQGNRGREAIDVLTAGLDYFPRDAELAERLGDALQRNRNWAGALSAYQLALEADAGRRTRLEPTLTRLQRLVPGVKLSSVQP